MKKVKNKDLQILQDLNESLKSPKVQKEVQQARIENPAKEVETSLVSYVTHRFDKLEKNTEFEESIKAHILARMPEATFSQLVDLYDTVRAADNRDSSVMLSGFTSPQSENALLDNLKEADTSSAAVKVYNSTDDKNVLQAINYLGQVMASLQEVDKKKKSLAPAEAPKQQADTPQSH